MITFEVNDHALRQRLEKLVRQFPSVSSRALYRIGSRVRDTSAKYAPKSPTFAESKKRSKATKAQWSAAKNRRSARSTSRRMPGTLQRSITFKNTSKYVDIYVPSNSMAGKYAVKMHDERGKTWKHLGAGSKAKGPQAREKFIDRAAKHHNKNGDIKRILESELAKVGL